MLGSIIRNYKNAGVNVKISLCVQQVQGDKQFRPLFTHEATGLGIHNLASSAHRELLRQARGSSLPRLPGMRFEDLAWKVAASVLVEAIPSLQINRATEVPLAIPYACFIAEYLSKSYRQQEGRDVCISAGGEVFINSFAGMNTDSKTLGNFRA